MNELSLFAGAGGGILAGHILGWRTVCAVEFDPYAASVLVARQNEGILPPFPIWDDVRTFDGTPWRGLVDVVSGGFPCQDISSAGRGAGISGSRSGLWSEMARIVREVRPRYVYAENSPNLAGRGLDRVLSDLAAMGFDAEWGVLGAADVGAPHQRDRIWIAGHSNRNSQSASAIHDETSGMRELVADPTSQRQQGLGGGAWLSSDHETDCEGQANLPVHDGESTDSNSPQREGRQLPGGIDSEHADAGIGGWWDAEPDVGRVANGVAARVDRLKAIGNGQVPICAAAAWKMLSGLA